MGKYPSYKCRQLDRRLLEIGCEYLRSRGSHRHYSNPFHPDRIITFSWHPGDVPRGIVADIIEDLGITRDEFYFGKSESRCRFTRSAISHNFFDKKAIAIQRTSLAVWFLNRLS